MAISQERLSARRPKPYVRKHSCPIHDPWANQHLSGVRARTEFRPWRLGPPLLAGLLAGLVAGPLAGAELVPHRAAYSLKIGEVRPGGAVVDVSGLMTMAVEKSCDGWILAIRRVMKIVTADGGQFTRRHALRGLGVGERRQASFRVARQYRRRTPRIQGGGAPPGGGRPRRGRLQAARDQDNETSRGHPVSPRSHGAAYRSGPAPARARWRAISSMGRR